MKKLLILACCIMMMTLLTGCFGGGGGGSSGGGGILGDIAGIIDDGSGDDPGGLPHSPEPVTIALIGGGLVAFAFLRRKKK
jgi:hypothetical protein